MNDSQIKPWRLGVVSFLNSRPLIAGLELEPRVDIVLDVPSRLPEMLDRGEVDAALVPVVDLFGDGRDWRILSDACIGCDGETLTVRVFSKGDPKAVTRLLVDGDSHTSVALASVIWQEMYGTRLEIEKFEGNEPADDSVGVLLIGDKVVNHSLIHCDRETDLGAAWKSLTSLPFVFAVWAAPRHLALEGLAERLSVARDRGVESAQAIAADLGPGLGWPVTQAVRYLTTRLRFTLGQRQREGMATFLELARSHNLIPHGKDLIFV